MADNAWFEAREAQRGASLSAKVGMVFAMVGVVAMANIAVARIMVREQNGVAETVNVAGKLRMLSQKIAFEAAVAGPDPHRRSSRLKQACEDYEAALDALANGGNAFGYQVNRPSLALDARLAKLRAEWPQFRFDAARAAAGEEGPVRAAALEAVAQGATRMLGYAEDIVGVMTEEARHAQRTALARMYALLAANFLLLSMAFAFARRKIVLPLRRLAQQSRELAAGNYSARPVPESHDEIGQLAHSFNHAACRIGELVERIDSDRRELQLVADKLEYSANHDALTGLANRNLLADRLHQAIAAARRRGNMVAVLLHDLDNFKVINDSLGHVAGDELLVQVARRMKAAVRETDTVARLGGDEFVIVMPDVARPDDAAAVAGKVLEALAEPFHVESQDVFVHASIGISLFPRDGADEQALLKNVDLAMYRAKHQGRGRISFFTEEMNAANRTRQQLEAELHRALERQEFVLHYQPRLDLRTGCINCVEALLRWQHPRHGMVPPAGFIPLAEETGLIVSIGAWVLEEACRQNRLWRKQGLGDVGVAVNLSMRQLQSEGLLPLVLGVLEGSDMDARCLELEITETAVMKDAEAAMQQLRKLKDAGVRLALDDFGTGYSSLDYLRRFPLDCLKIDRSFVAEIQPGAKESSLVSAMIAMAGTLGLTAIAEGVETREQAEFLRLHGCHETQGYYFSRPLPAAEIGDVLRKRLAQCVA